MLGGQLAEGRQAFRGQHLRNGLRHAAIVPRSHGSAEPRWPDRRNDRPEVRPLPHLGRTKVPLSTTHELAQIESLFPVIHETRESLPIWRDLVTRCGVSGRQAHDARLAPVMLANDVTHVLTFNGNDFARQSA
jgi:hypothetical protein